ncbi:MAG TPA: GAF domain-containing protein [Aggregatilineaceae bacterium]|nr:GAF domain-containing protein [Aggregatilineaceae bacterium]
MSQQRGLVQRLISFLKRPEIEQAGPVHNTYDDYAPREATAATAPPIEAVADTMGYATEMGSADRSPTHGSRLDALLVRALQQFNAQVGYVIRSEQDGRMQYCTGRDAQGRYIYPTEADPDRRAIFLALDSGESQLFVHTTDDNTPIAVLCGPLYADEQIIGVLYLDNPARSRLHRGVFDVFCDQASRMLAEGIS